ncbi:MAG: Ribosomal silencing factor RsfS [Chlamydiae bacterium]|nr:Ribosomal silencing factor RsfS [Chlamydiota bacterium]
MLTPEPSKLNTDESRNLVNKLFSLIEESLGRNIFVIDIRRVSTLCDFCIIAEGRVDRHVRSIAKNLEATLKKEGISPVKMEGLQEGNWAILDYLNVMVHVLTPSFREKYRLERLWEEGTIVDPKSEE